MTEDELRKLEAALRTEGTQGEWVMYAQRHAGLRLYCTGIDDSEGDSIAEMLRDDDVAEKNAALIVAEHAAVPLLIAEVRRLQAETARQAEEIDEWKCAAGINRGSDPERLQPSDLQRYVGLMDRVVARSRPLAPPTTTEATCTWGFDLRVALDDLDREFPEE